MYLFYRRPMKMARLLILVFTLIGIKAHSQDIARPLSLTMQDTNLSEILGALDKQTDFTFSYDPAALAKISLKEISYQALPLRDILADLKSRTGLDYMIRQSAIVFRLANQPKSPEKKQATITGKILDEASGEGIPNVSIRIGQKNAVSDIDGFFSIGLPAGKYEGVLTSVGYTNKEIADITVADNQVLELNLTLSRQKSYLANVVVKSSTRREGIAALYSRQKNNSAITDGISAEQIRVTPDNNTAQVLKRVSGITVQNEKFVTIRGVSDRYNNVLINGASLPSTEPNRRNFSFDIIPSALVDNIVVNKTATPDLPGEFAGGLIQITAKDVPLKNFLDITVGTGFNTASDGRKLLSFKRDEQAWLGKADHERKWFGDGRLIDPAEYGRRVNIQKDTAFRNATGAKMPSRWKVHEYPYAPLSMLQVNGGLVKRFTNGNSLGFIAALTYRNENLYEEGEARVLQQYDFNTRRYRNLTTIGALFNTAFKSKHHKISFKNLYNHKYSDQFDQQIGAYISDGWYARRRSEVTLINDLLLTKLEGEHSIGNTGIKADWFGEYIQLTREQPDTRFVTARSNVSVQDLSYQFFENGKYTYDFNNPTLVLNGLYASRLEETKKNGGFNIALPFRVGETKQLFKTGYSYSERGADYDGTGFKIRETNGSNAYDLDTRGLPYEEISRPEAFATGRLEYFAAYTRSETTGDRYTGTQKLQSAYGLFDLKFFQKLRVIGGMRYEQNRISLSTVQYNLQGYAVFRDTVYYEKDWLPSVNLVYSLTDKLNIRAAFSKTLARPDFVERSPYIYYDFVELTEVQGQKALKSSRIRNYDLRVEYYPGPNEIISASLFYKKFTDPVERFYVLNSAMNIVEYWNLLGATAKGFELDARKSLGFIAPGNPFLQNLYISGNFTSLKGGISFIVNEKSRATNKDTSYVSGADRPIQGLSPYIINGGLNYTGKVWGFNLAYNRIGRRIVNGGTVEYLVQYENPRDVLDFQLSGRLMRQKLEVRFNVSDLLNQYYIIYSNNVNKSGNNYPGGNLSDDPKGTAFNEAVDLVNYKVKKGTGYTLTFTYKW